MALVAAPASNANSYCTRAEAAAYLADLPAARRTGWDAATDAERDLALVAATQALEARNWVGVKTHALADNALRWPRAAVYNADGQAIDSATVPAAIKSATAELAEAVLSERVNSAGGTASGSSAVSAVSVGSIEVAYGEGAATEEYRSAFPNAVELLIAPYLATGGGVRAIRG